MEEQLANLWACWSCSNSAKSSLLQSSDRDRKRWPNSKMISWTAWLGNSSIREATHEAAVWGRRADWHSQKQPRADKGYNEGTTPGYWSITGRNAPTTDRRIIRRSGVSAKGDAGGAADRIQLSVVEFQAGVEERVQDKIFHPSQAFSNRLYSLYTHFLFRCRWQYAEKYSLHCMTVIHHAMHISPRLGCRRQQWVEWYKKYCKTCRLSVVTMDTWCLH